MASTITADGPPSAATAPAVSDVAVQSPTLARPQPAAFEVAAAMLLLRAFLGLRALFGGIEKFELQGTYSFANYRQSMTRMATGITGASFLPLWATKTFALTLGFVLLALGVSLLLGLKTRASLVLMGLTYLGLAAGLMAVQETDGATAMGVHVALVAFALVLSRHDRFALWPDRR